MIDNNYIKHRILESKDPKYRDFHAKLVPNIDCFIGVRVPILRSIAKEVTPEGMDTYFTTLSLELYEEKMVCGFVIASLKEIEIVIDKITMFVPYIDNWAICDSFCASLKIARKYPEKILQLIKEYLKSEDEYKIRFCIVMLLDHYIIEKYIDEVLAIYSKINSDKYYISMALAWALSVCFIKFPDKTSSFIAKETLDIATLKRYNQKCRDSLRIR